MVWRWTDLRWENGWQAAYQRRTCGEAESCGRARSGGKWQGRCYMVFCKVEPPALLRPVPRLEHMEQLRLERVRGI